MRAFAVLVGLLLLGVPARASAGLGQLEPYQMLRSLQLVQDRIAAGDHAALPMQRKLMALLDKRFQGIGVAELNDDKNVEAFLIYAMSGGSAQTVANLLPRIAARQGETVIASGVLSFLRGDTPGAARILGQIDATRIDGDVGAYLALVKGSLVNDFDEAEIVANLNYARLLAPGTLIEEAAIRRLLLIYARSGEAAQFVRMAELYARRFLRSPFADQFADSFVRGLVDMDTQISEADIRDVTVTVPQNYRKAIYLRLARQAALNGKTGLLSRTLSALGGSVSETGGEDATGDERSRLYAAIASIDSGDSEALKRKLLKIDAEALPEEDRALLAASLALHDAIVKEDPAAQPMPRPASAKPAPESAPAHEEAPARAEAGGKKIRTVYSDGREPIQPANAEPAAEPSRPAAIAGAETDRPAMQAHASQEPEGDIEDFVAQMRDRLDAADDIQSEVK